MKYSVTIIPSAPWPDSRSHLPANRMKAIALWLLRELKRCLFVLIYGGRRSHADYAIVNLEGSRHPSPLTTVYHKLQPTNACPYTFLQELFGNQKPFFNMINELPTIFEVFTGTKKQLQEKSSGSNHGGNNSKSNSKARGSESVGKHSKAMQTRDEEEELDEVYEHGETLCGACGENYGTGEFWICCDICKNWFHGKCVKITPARAQHIKQYKCPSCSNKRTRS
ncbi:hypothetical protein K1719_019454 [Acacia pycnantha]|nr:hypothetical protein K1719_019454 [Acacia pycnantha]